MQKFECGKLLFESMKKSVVNEAESPKTAAIPCSPNVKYAVSDFPPSSMQNGLQVKVSDAGLLATCADKANAACAERSNMAPKIDPDRSRYPFCIVWTPIIPLTWLFPFIGHMGIARSDGIIRDFAGPYFVSEDDMAFGPPTLYWQLDPALASGGSASYDAAVQAASAEYFTRMHNLFCDNCHSMVALALNQMRYQGKGNWSMMQVCIFMLLKGRYVSFGAALKTWLPFTVLVGLIVTLVLVL